MLPNRYPEVAAICARFPASFPHDAAGHPTADNDAARLVLLQRIIIPTLNLIDDGQWGYLTKTDQDDKVPCDILMWRPTNEVIDCMTGSGACWIPHAPPPPEWIWTSVEPFIPPVDPTPPDASVPVFFGAVARIGTIVPQAAGVVLINPDGEVASLQPDGRLEWRAPGTVGAYELATRDGANLLRYDGTGSVYYVAVQERRA